MWPRPQWRCPAMGWVYFWGAGSRLAPPRRCPTLTLLMGWGLCGGHASTHPEALGTPLTPPTPPVPPWYPTTAAHIHAPISPLPAHALGRCAQGPAPRPSRARPRGTRVEPLREEPGPPRRVPVFGAGGTRRALVPPLDSRPPAAPALCNSFRLSPGEEQNTASGRNWPGCEMGLRIPLDSWGSGHGGQPAPHKQGMALARGAAEAAVSWSWGHRGGEGPRQQPRPQGGVWDQRHGGLYSPGVGPPARGSVQPRYRGCPIPGHHPRPRLRWARPLS